MALNSLYFLKFNNFYNRQVKGLGFTFDDYVDYWAHTPDELDYYGLSEVSFYPADGVDTQHTVNTDEEYPFAADFDYLLVVGPNNTIESRWFVVNTTRLCVGQYVVSLHRDLIVDYFEEVKNAPCYVERAMLPIKNNLIFNSEGMSFNQIKKKEVLLQDKSKTPWIVGYLAPNVFKRDGETNSAISLSATLASSTDIYPTFSMDTIQTWANKEYVVGPTIEGTSKARITGNRGHGAATGEFYFNCLTGNTTEDVFATTTTYKVGLSLTTTTLKAYENLRAAAAPRLAEFEALCESKKNYGTEINTETLKLLREMSGKTVKDPVSGTLFTFTLYSENGGDISYYAKDSSYPGFDLFKSVVDNAKGVSYYENEPTFAPSFEVWSTHALYSIGNFQIVPSGISVSGTISTTVNKAEDAPYYIFAAPLFATNIRYDIESGTIEGTTKPMLVQQLISDLSRQLVSGQYLYDLQLLPFAPQQILNYYSEYFLDTIDLSGDWFNEKNSVTKFTYKDPDSNQTRIGAVMFWLKSSSFRTNIEFNEPLPTEPVEFKIANECDRYRIVSPNYAGAFEFSATKNGGITGFEINCTYKPYQPYIHINPRFGGLYGGDYNDNRGLICGGDFTLPQTVDQWQNYQIQNKSYQESFNRQVENLETTYSIEREQQKTAAIIGAISGGISGFGSGMLAGGGGVSGAVVGTAMAGLAVGANIYGMNKDLEYADKLHKEATSFAKDQFSYSLQNIQALPQTLSRTSAFDINAKYFPFLEYYTCTEEEKEALRQKIKYNSMTVMTIGTIEQFIQENPSFISAQLIRIENLGEDYHLATAIAAELHKGIYV